ncbi:MAG: hypothetical protein WBE26_11430 [Phycisphaerae bacterium]
MKRVTYTEMSFSKLLLCGLVLIVVIMYSCAQAQLLKGKSPEDVAREVCKDVGKVGKSFQGTKGAPILMLEEVHNSRAGQIEHAITLVRLYERYGLRHIALEGYLKERPEIRTDWFTRAATGLSPTTKARVAVRLLKEGENSCAEFMDLVYHDLVLCPIERKQEYSVELPAEAAGVPLLYLLKIAERSLTDRHMSTIERLQNDLERLDAAKDSETYQKKLKEMIDYILSADPWAWAKAQKIQDEEAIRTTSGEQHMALIEEIVSRAKQLTVKMEPEEKQAMDRYMSFWRGRMDASKTMVLSAGGIADQPDVPIIAMVIGAAHTEGMCAMLKKAGRSFAVITPLSYGNEEEMGNLTWEMLERKYKRQSVYSEGFMETFLKSFPAPNQKKPEPVLSEAWFQGKAELYLFTERIARHVLGPPSPPAGGRAPFGFADDAFDGRWVFIDPNGITLIPETEDQVETVLFRVILNPNDPARRTEIWAKVGLTNPIVPAQERESVESMLRRALTEVRSQRDPSTRVEDSGGRVRITLNTTAGYAPTQAAAQAIHTPR